MYSAYVLGILCADGEFLGADEDSSALTLFSLLEALGLLLGLLVVLSQVLGGVSCEFDHLKKVGLFSI